ncbi:MAG TPA: hypothetical protein VEZ12_00655 [Herpetosiphonaceae bacterium]|nr:hypothetical protein [Herpetosiphonaceae bacterium]
MQHRIVWIHGIGNHSTGYSASWQATFNTYLQLAADNYVEVCWEEVFQAARATARGSTPESRAVALTPDEQRDEAAIRAELETLLLARASALGNAQAPATARGAADTKVVEWSQVYRAPRARGILDWVFNPDEYLGDFVKYLVSRNVRNAVKEKAKERLRPLAGVDYRISIVGHSWGSVVAYDSLLDLEAEQPGLQVANLVTLGSPLWMVQRFLDERSGRKPRQTGSWINIHARRDVIGSWLKPGFLVDKEWEVPDFGGAGPHSSYFEANNVAVQRDIVAQYILAAS